MGKKCYCHTCSKGFHYLGINMHRAMHRNRNEDCKITYTYGDTHTFHFSQNKIEDNIKKCEALAGDSPISIDIHYVAAYEKNFNKDGFVLIPPVEGKSIKLLGSGYYIVVDG